MDDPVEALAITLWKAWRSDPHIAVHDWSEIPDMLREPFRNMARAALAFARERVAEPEPREATRDAIWHAIGYNSCRAETLARLGGEETT